MKTHREASRTGECLSCERCELICKEENTCYKDDDKKTELIVHFVGNSYVSMLFNTKSEAEDTRDLLTDRADYKINRFVTFDNHTINVGMITFMEVRDA